MKLVPSFWAQMLIAVPNLPSPSEWGWVETSNGGWEVKWTTLPEACRELIRCGCKKGCRSRCKCVKAACMLYSVLLCVSVEANVTVTIFDH